MLRLALGTAAFIVAGFVGRGTIIDGESLSMVWPAAGIAGLWIGSGNRTTWPTDFLALGAATFVVNSVTGASTAIALVFMVTNVVQVGAFVIIMRQLLPDLWGFGGTRPLARVADLGRIATASLLACLIGALLGAAGLTALLGEVEVSSFMVWWGRNTIALLVVVTLGVLAGQPLATAPSSRAAAARLLAALVPESPGRLLEALALPTASACVSAILFVDPTGRPLAFLALLTSVWAGLRFSPLAVGLHGVAVGATGIYFTLLGEGPFASIADLHYRALVAQIFVAMAVLTGMSLALSRTERDQANRDLAEARRSADDRARLLDAVLESMKEGIFVIDETGAILVRNTAARELSALVGDLEDRIQPAATYRLFHPNGLPVLDDELPAARALAGEPVEPVDLHLRLPLSQPPSSGGYVLEVTAQPLHDDDPTAPRRAMVNTRDVTADRQQRDTLASFAGVVAHDLATPVSVIDGWAEALTDEFDMGPVSPVVGRLMVARIQGAAGHMRDFIADLMNYTVARDQSLRLGAVDLTTAARSLGDLRSTKAGAPVIAVEEGLQVWADAGMIRQLLDNLIGNAVKYVAPGVRPTIEITGRQLDATLEVRVTDNGIGIPEDELEAVFDSFHRAHGESFRGTGLGLAICRRIVERHGGTIHVEHGPRGVGSTFVLTLPVVPAPVALRR